MKIHIIFLLCLLLSFSTLAGTHTSETPKLENSNTWTAEFVTNNLQSALVVDPLKTLSIYQNYITANPSRAADNPDNFFIAVNYDSNFLKNNIEAYKTILLKKPKEALKHKDIYQDAFAHDITVINEHKVIFLDYAKSENIPLKRISSDFKSYDKEKGLFLTDGPKTVAFSFKTLKTITNLQSVTIKLDGSLEIVRSYKYETYDGEEREATYTFSFSGAELRNTKKGGVSFRGGKLETAFGSFDLTECGPTNKCSAGFSGVSGKFYLKSKTSFPLPWGDILEKGSIIMSQNREIISFKSKGTYIYQREGVKVESKRYNEGRTFVLCLTDYDCPNIARGLYEPKRDLVADGKLRLLYNPHDGVRTDFGGEHLSISASTNLKIEFLENAKNKYKIVELNTNGHEIVVVKGKNSYSTKNGIKGDMLELLISGVLFVDHPGYTTKYTHNDDVVKYYLCIDQEECYSKGSSTLRAAEAFKIFYQDSLPEKLKDTVLIQIGSESFEGTFIEGAAGVAGGARITFNKDIDFDLRFIFVHELSHVYFAQNPAEEERWINFNNKLGTKYDPTWKISSDHQELSHGKTYDVFFTSYSTTKVTEHAPDSISSFNTQSVEYLRKEIWGIDPETSSDEGKKSNPKLVAVSAYLCGRKLGLASRCRILGLDWTTRCKQVNKGIIKGNLPVPQPLLVTVCETAYK